MRWSEIHFAPWAVFIWTPSGRARVDPTVNESLITDHYGRGAGVGRGLGVGAVLGVGVGLGVVVAVAVAVAVGVAVGGGVAVGVGVGVTAPASG
jgi:hypothetical protein